MSAYEKAMQPIADWIAENHPAYAGWRVRSFHWEYDIANEMPYEITWKLNDAFETAGEISKEDVEPFFSQMSPPEGYAFVTVQKDNKRVGINVPRQAFSDWKPEEA